MAPPPSTDVRGALRTALKGRMVTRDRVAVEIIRVAIGAVENVEARPIEHLAGAGWSAREDAPTAAEVARREVLEGEARAIVRTVVAELEDAAREYRDLGRHDLSERATAQAAVGTWHQVTAGA